MCDLIEDEEVIHRFLVRLFLDAQDLFLCLEFFLRDLEVDALHHCIRKILPEPFLQHRRDARLPGAPDACRDDEPALPERVSQKIDVGLSRFDLKFLQL